MKRDRAIHVQKELVELDLRDYSEATKRALLQDGEELSWGADRVLAPIAGLFFSFQDKRTGLWYKNIKFSGRKLQPGPQQYQQIQKKKLYTAYNTVSLILINQPKNR